MSLFPEDIHLSEYGERAQFAAFREVAVPTPMGVALIQYVIYTIDGGPKVHAHFEEWSYGYCTEAQKAWLHENVDQLKAALAADLSLLKYA